MPINPNSHCKQIHQKLLLHLSLIMCFAFVSDTLHASVLLGSKVPDFQAQDLQGKQHRLSKYAGQIVVLEWSSPECPYSRRYYQDGTLSSLYEFAAKNNITWINIVPKLETLTRQQVTERIDTSMKVVILDETLDISTAYDARTTPQILIINQKGILSYSGAIDSTAMLKTTASKVVPYTRNALEDLLTGREVRKKITRAFGCYIKNKAELKQVTP